MMRASIGLRLAAWYAGLLAAALAIFGFLAVWQLRRTVFAAADAQLAQVVTGAETVIRQSIGQGQAELREEIGEYADALKPAVGLDVRMNGIPLTVPGSFDSTSRSMAVRLELSGRLFHIRAVVSIASGLTMVRTFTRALAVLAPLLLIFACAAGYWISRRALEPVDEITREARSIGLENLSRRIRVRAGADELARLSGAWNEMLARLEESVLRLSRFTADASHEMRSPIAVIRATAELALRRSERSAEEYRAALEEVSRQAERLSSLVEDLLALARAEEGADQAFAIVDLAGAARAACDLVGPVAREKNLRLIAELPPDGIEIRGHEPSIRRLLMILLDNAVKFSPEGGRVAVQVMSSSPAAVSLTVADNGPGIAPQDLPHIFERFYRADRVRTPGVAGAGLGLSLAESIAKSHGAQIRTETEQGRGSVFRVTFPAAVAERQDQAGDSNAENRPSASTP